jgi:lipopolysaccharide export system permease protein
LRIPILYRYIFKEVLGPFLIALFVFTGILFLARSLKLVELVVNKNVPVGDILVLFAYLVPRFLEIAIPMALLLGVVIGFGRLSSDSELVVIRSVGLNLNRLSRPVLVFSTLAALITFSITLWIRPWASYQLGIGMFELARSRASAGLSAGVFNRLGPLTIYAEEISDKGERLSNVIIGDASQDGAKRTFIAKHGKIVSDRETRSLGLQLYDGSIPEGYGDNFTLTHFEVNNISLPLSALTDDTDERTGKKSREMYVGELRAAAKEYDDIEQRRALDKKELANRARYLVEFHKRFAIPSSCIFISLLALALGIQPSRGDATWGGSVSIGVGVLLILLYYLLFALTTALAEQSILPAFILVWIPNILLGSLGLYLFRKMGSEQWLTVSQAVGIRIRQIADRLRIGGQ